MTSALIQEAEREEVEINIDEDRADESAVVLQRIFELREQQRE